MKDRSVEDTISEREYTMRMKSRSSKPEDDSPGDSESDAGAEFQMGMEYLPDERNDSEIPSEPKLKYPVKDVSGESAVISSELPSPWMDASKSSSLT